MELFLLLPDFFLCSNFFGLACASILLLTREASCHQKLQSIILFFTHVVITQDNELLLRTRKSTQTTSTWIENRSKFDSILNFIHQ